MVSLRGEIAVGLFFGSSLESNAGKSGSQRWSKIRSIVTSV
jgi:hypothetical protein